MSRPPAYRRYRTIQLFPGNADISETCIDTWPLPPKQPGTVTLRFVDSTTDVAPARTTITMQGINYYFQISTVSIT
jgi:hypothetical protein